MPTKIPVFVSAPTKLNRDQQLSYDKIITLLDHENLERRALGRSEYPTEYPLKEVYLIARHCSGGMILGYSQSIARQLEIKPGTVEPKTLTDIKLPTPWNQLEAGILFSLRLPLMVFREEGASGGVFDNGVSDAFINPLPVGRIGKKEEEKIRLSIQTWGGRVRDHYRQWK